MDIYTYKFMCVVLRYKPSVALKKVIVLVVLVASELMINPTSTKLLNKIQ